MIVMTDNIEIFRKEECYIVRHKLINKYIRLGSRETSYLLLLLGESEKQIPKEEGYIPLNEEQKELLKSKFSTMGFLDKKAQPKKKEIFDFVLCSLQNNCGMNKVLNILSYLISSIGFLLMIFSIGCSIYFMYTFPEKYLYGLYSLLEEMDLLWIVKMYVIFFISGVIHELAHAAACYRYSGSSGRIGIKLYYGIPAFFSDLSNMYIVSGKKRSVITSLAGVASNIIIAGITVSLYVLVPIDSQIGLILLSAFILNVVAVIFNLIPFAKFDGYWVIRNLTNINNLYDKSISIVFLMIFAIKEYKSLAIGTAKKVVMTLYGVLCYLFTYYLWYIFIKTIHYFLTLFGARDVVYGCVMLLAVIIFLISTVMTVNKYKKIYRSFCQNIL